MFTVISCRLHNSQVRFMGLDPVQIFAIIVAIDLIKVLILDTLLIIWELTVGPGLLWTMAGYVAEATVLYAVVVVPLTFSMSRIEAQEPLNQRARLPPKITYQLMLTNICLLWPRCMECLTTAKILS